MAKPNFKKTETPTPQEVRKTLAEPEATRPEPDAPKNKGGRPKSPVSRESQISLKIRSDVYEDMKRIAGREGITLTALIERAIPLYEERRLAKALELVERQEGESDDDVIRRAFGW